MSTAPLAPTARPRRRRVRRLVARLSLAGAALLVLLGLTRRLWLPPFVRAAGPPICRALVGFELELEEVVAADLDHLALRGVRLTRRDPSFPVRSGTAAELEARFSIRRLVSEGLPGLFEVRGRAVALELDLTAPPAEDDGSPPAPLPARLPVLDVEGLDLTLLLPDFELEARGVTARSADGAALELSTGPLRLVEGGRERSFERVALALRWVDARADGLALELDGEPRLADVAVDLSNVVEQGTLAASGTLLTPGGAAAFDLALQPGTLALEVDARALALDRLRPFLPGALADLEGTVELALQGALDLADPAASRAEARLSASGLAAAGWRAERAVAAVRLADRALTVDELEVVDGPNAVRAHALEIALADLDAQEWIRRLRGEVELSLSDAARLGRLPSPELEALLEDARLELAAEIGAGRARIDRLDLGLAGARARLLRGRVALEPLDAPELDVELDVIVEDLAALLAPFGVVGPRGGLAGTVQATGRYPRLDARAVFEASALELPGLTLGDVGLDARLSRERLELSRLVAHSDWGTIDVHGALALETQRLEDVELSVDVQALERLLPDAARGGSVQAGLSLSGDLRAPSARLEARGAGVALGGLPACDALLSARAVDRTLVLDGLRVRAGAVSGFASGRARLDAELAPQDLVLETLDLRAEGRTALALRDPVRVELAPDGARLSGAVLSGDLGWLRVDAERDARGFALELEVAGLEPTPLVAALLPPGLGVEHVDLDLDLALRDGLLDADATLRADGLRLSGIAGPVSLVARVGDLDGGGLEATVAAELAGAGRVGLAARAPFDPARPLALAPGRVALELDVVLDDLGAALAGSEPALGLPGRPAGALRARAALGGEWSRLCGAVALDGRELELLDPAGARAYGPAELSALVSVGDAIALEALSLRAGPEGEALRAVASGAVLAPLDLAALLADPRAWLDAAPLDLRARAGVDEVGRLARLVGALEERDLPLRAGRVELAAAVGGTLGQPLPSGALALEGGVLRLGSEFPSVDRLELVATLEPGELRLERLGGELGGAPFVGLGAVDLRGEVPVLDLRIAGENLLLARSRELRARADCSLLLYGTPHDTTVAGLVELVDARFVKNFEIDLTRGVPSAEAGGLQIFRFREPPLADLRFDVDLRAREPVKLKNTTIDGAVRPDLHLGGTGVLPILTGSIFLEPTWVKLPGSTLRFETGTIRFLPSNPFVPTLALNGGTRMRGYDIQVVVSGDLEQPEITLSSSPPLSNEKLLVLVTSGQLPVEGDAGSTATNTATALATYLAEDLFARNFGGTGEGESLLSRFDVIAGQDLTRSGAETIWVSFRMNARDPKRRTNYYLTGERDVYDYYNYGVRFVFRFR